MIKLSKLDRFKIIFMTLKVWINIKLRKRQTPILFDSIRLPVFSYNILEFKKNYKIIYLDHNIYSHLINPDNTFLEFKKAILDKIVNDQWLIVYSLQNIEETSLFISDPCIQTKSSNYSILTILDLIREMTHGLMIHPDILEISSESPYEIFNMINDDEGIHFLKDWLEVIFLIVSKKEVKRLRDYFNIYPKEINNCKNAKDAIDFINRKIDLCKSKLPSPIGDCKSFEDLLKDKSYLEEGLMNHLFEKASSGNKKFDYFVKRAFFLELFGFHAQKDFNLKCGLMSDFVHGYISTLCDIFISNDKKLLQSLKFKNNLGENGTELLSPSDFIKKYKK